MFDAWYYSRVDAYKSSCWALGWSDLLGWMQACDVYVILTLEMNLIWELISTRRLADSSEIPFPGLLVQWNHTMDGWLENAFTRVWNSFPLKVRLHRGWTGFYFNEATQNALEGLGWCGVSAKMSAISFCHWPWDEYFKRMLPKAILTTVFRYYDYFPPVAGMF